MKITLCGSTRFQKEFLEWNRDLTLAGHTVYSLAMFGRQFGDTNKGKDDLSIVTDEQKIILDLAHLTKIDESEAVVILNVGGYIGDNTRHELTWARMRGKCIYWLEQSHDVFKSLENEAHHLLTVESPLNPSAWGE